MSRGTLFVILAVIIGGLSTVGCKSQITGQLKAENQSSLKLYEESIGSLTHLEAGTVTLELFSEPFESLAKWLTSEEPQLNVRLLQNGRTFSFEIDPRKLAADKSFTLSEVDLGQPVRIEGQLIDGTLNDHKTLNLKIYKGFSGKKDPTWSFESIQFRTELKEIDPADLKQAAL